ncbi:MAG: hypothetical protein RBR77_04275 [Thauera sp.]|jgi:hypothetical protein|nr:hypothetical protein [Thauera sp.]
MTTHDIDIELPPLPEWADTTLQGEDRDSLFAWAEAAIEADRKQRSNTKPSTNQDWLSLDPAVAFHLIERHAENWNDAGAMMQAYLDAHIEAYRKRRGEPVGWVTPSVVDMLRDGKFATVCPTPFLAALPVYLAPQPAESVSKHPDDAAVDAFAAAMKAKLKRVREEKGRGGWQDMSATELSAMLREHVEKGDPVDVANLAMMLHQNGQGITPTEPEHATLNLQPSSSLQPVATAFFTEQGEVAYTGIYDRTLKALEAVKTTRLGISSGSIDLYAAPQPAEPVKIDVDDLAQEIRRVDGKHSLGAAALAEALLPFLSRTAEPVKVPSDDIDIEDVRQYLDSWGCLAHPGVRALLARYGKGAPSNRKGGPVEP